MAVIVSTDQDFKAQLQQHPRVVVKCFASWCGSCRLFAPKFRRLSADERFEDITFLDVNAEENPEARKLAGVDNLPFFATFLNGERQAGTATSKEEKVVELLDQLTAKA